jgi:hypothetical protein
MSEPPTAGSLTTDDLPQIVERYRNGESLQELAKGSPVVHRQLYNWMLNGLGDVQYEQIVTECLINRIADADQKLEEGCDSIHIARAREMSRYARMDFERRRPHLYGPKQEVKTDTTITVIVQRERQKATVIAQAETQALPSLEIMQADDSGSGPDIA